MIKDKQNKGTGYAEEFDVARLEEIAEKAKHNKGTKDLSDLECFVYEIMRDLVEFGKSQA